MSQPRPCSVAQRHASPLDAQSLQHPGAPMLPRRASRVVSFVLGFALGTGVLAHEQAAVRALPWHEGRVATRAYHWPCCRPMSRPAALAIVASRCPGRACAAKSPCTSATGRCAEEVGRCCRARGSVIMAEGERLCIQVSC